jgi:uncharacterized phage infection (PIP) family protein YhgE
VSDPAFGTESTDTTNSSEEVTQETTGPETGGGDNPAWADLRSALDPISYNAAKPFLSKFDQEANGRISKLNGDLKPYRELGDVQTLQQAVQVMRNLDEHPEKIYEALGNFLRENGRMPETQAEVQEAVENAEEIDPRDQQFQQLQEQQEQMRQFLENQEQQRVAAAAEADLSTEIEQLQQAHPDFGPADVREVLQRAAYAAINGGGKAPSLEEVASDYIENTVNRIRSAPRPGDSAPRLLPTSGGGTPSGESAQKSLGKASRDDVQSVVANLLAGGR